MRLNTMVGRLSWERGIMGRIQLYCVFLSIIIGKLFRRFYFDSRRDLMAPGKIDRENKLQLGVFISRTLWSWPSCLEEVVPAVSSQAIQANTSSSKMIFKSPLHLLA